MDEENIVQGMVPLEPIPEGTAGQQIYEALLNNRSLPDAVINIEKNYSISYEEIYVTSVKLALSLQNCGYGKDNILAICCENSYLYYYPLLAGFYLGIAVAPLNQDYIKDELHHAISLSQPNIVFCSLKNLNKIMEVKSHLPSIERIILLDSAQKTDGVETLADFITENMKPNYDITNFKPIEFDRNEHVALIMCSSGTTGLPKGVMLTHKNLIVRLAISRDERFAYTTGTDLNTTSVCPVPMVHVAGLVVVLHQLLHGYKLILMDKFNPDTFLKAIQDYRIACIFAVPSLIGFLAKSSRVDKYDISSLKLMVCATAPLPKETEDLALQRLKFVEGIAQAYGLTETTATVLMSPIGKYRSGSSGKVLPFVSAKIVDINTGKALGPNKNGELYFKGGVLMKGYINNEAATKETIDEDGWLHTGDIGYYDDDEFFYIVDRIKELIKYKGFQVPPAELESLLLLHPEISDAGVIGIPDEQAGELPTAFIVKQPNSNLTADTIVEFIAISDVKRLRGGVYFLEQLPRNHSGKILRRELRQLALDILKK